MIARTYARLALATTAATIAATLLLAPLLPAQRSHLFIVVSLTASLLATLACLLTARRIGYRDRLGVAWLSVGISQGFLFATGLLVGDTTRTVTVTLSPTVEWVRNSFTLFANLFNIVAYVLFARVWSGTGLVPRWRWLATVVSIIVAVAVAGRTTWDDLLLARSMHLDAMGNLFSDVGDIVSLSIIGPVAATAIALRGGALVWPWSLLSVSSVAWLVYDVGAYFGRGEQLVELSAIIAADLFALAAAIAQGMVARQAGREGQG